MKFVAAAVALAALVARPAGADVWQHAIEPEPHFDVYEALIAKGDDAIGAANTRSISIGQIRHQLDVGLEAYRAAAKADPSSAEPWFRIGAVLYSFFFDCEDYGGLYSVPKTCNPALANDDKAREMVDAWDRFEKLAPLDPRVNQILLSRAIARTKLVSSTADRTPLLEAAARDYRAILDREDGLLIGTAAQRTLVLGNLAETEMMLGHLDEAIDTYFAARRLGAGASTQYGLAVALDRDDRTGDALAIIRMLGPDAYKTFRDKYRVGEVFFVPRGEEQYYFALCDEAFGHDDAAVAHWNAFVASRAHPVYLPRAKEHLTRLLARKKLRWKAPLVPDMMERDLRRFAPLPLPRRP